MNYLVSFLIGGLLCIPAQILLDKTKLTNARILTGYVVAGVALSFFGLYGIIVDFAGCGATVPLTGFGHSLFCGVKKAVDAQGLLGALKGGLSGTSAGITAALVLALLWASIFKSKEK